MPATNKVNQFGENDDRPMTIDRWKEKWEAGQTRFHVPRVHPLLEKHVERILNGAGTPTVFLPMSGKSLDLKWLAEKGCKVIGNEVVDLGCQKFFEENNIPYKKESIQTIPGTVYESTDNKLRIKMYCCDFFKLNRQILGDIQAIWDRGSCASIEIEERKRYQQVISDICIPSTKILMEVFHLDHEVFIGPPHDFPKDEVIELFGRDFSVQQIDEKDCMGNWQEEWGVSFFISQIFFMTKKC